MLPFSRNSWLTKVLDGFNLLNPPQLFTALLYTLVYYGVLILQMYFLINSFSQISLTACVHRNKCDDVRKITAPDFNR